MAILGHGREISGVKRFCRMLSNMGTPSGAWIFSHNRYHQSAVVMNKPLARRSFSRSRGNDASDEYRDATARVAKFVATLLVMEQFEDKLASH